MPTALPSLSNAAVSFALTSYIVDLERAQDLETLDLHHERVGSYLAALQDVTALPGGDLRQLQELFSKLYRQRFSNLGGQGKL